MSTKIYPKAQIAMQNGDLVDVTNVRITTTNGVKQKHTLRQKGAGITIGVEETKVQFDSIISQDGPERDYFNAVRKAKIIQLRIKIPNETLTVDGCFIERDIDGPLDDAIKQGMQFVGHLV